MTQTRGRLQQTNFLFPGKEYNASLHTQFAYTSDAWASLAKNPQNREEVLRALVEKLGGRLLSFYYAFGEYDGVFITEMPDETTIAAAVLAAISPGHVRAIKTTVLLTTERAMEAMRKATPQSYQAPLPYSVA